MASNMNDLHLEFLFKASEFFLIFLAATSGLFQLLSVVVEKNALRVGSIYTLMTWC